MPDFVFLALCTSFSSLVQTNYFYSSINQYSIAGVNSEIPNIFSIFPIEMLALNQEAPASIESMLSKMPMQVTEAASQDAHTCIQKVICDILSDAIDIPRKASELKVKRKCEKNSAEGLLKQKRRIEEKLKDLKQKQLEYEQEIRKEKSESKHQSRLRSEFKEEEKEQIRRIRNKMKQFERKLKEKNNNYNEKLLEERQAEKQSLEQMQKTINVEKREIISRNLSLLRERSKERERIKEQEAMVLKKIQGKRKLHEILQSKWNHESEEAQKRNEEMEERRSRSRRTDFCALKEHEKKYQSIIAERKEQYSQRKKEMSGFENKSTLSFSNSKFYYLVEEEQRRVEQERQEGEERKRRIKQKKEKLLEQIRTNIIPKMKMRTADYSPETMTQSRVVTGLGKEDVQKMGDEYLRQGNEKIKRNRKDKDKENNYGEEMRSLGIKKIDYLCESRTLREKTMGCEIMSKFDNPRAAAHKILKNKNLEESEKIEELKRLAATFDSKKIDMVKKIKGKLNMLEAMA